MILALMPALVIGILLGSMWGSLYRVRGPRNQPQALLGGLFISTIVAGTLTWMASEYLGRTLADESIVWYWVGRLLPFYTPVIVAFAAIVAHMFRRRALIRHRLSGASAGATGVPSGVRDTPVGRGGSTLG